MSLFSLVEPTLDDPGLNNKRDFEGNPESVTARAHKDDECWYCVSEYIHIDIGIYVSIYIHTSIYISLSIYIYIYIYI